MQEKGNMVNWLSKPRWCYIIYNCFLVLYFSLKFLWSVTLAPFKVIVSLLYILNEVYVIIIESVLFLLRAIIVIYGLLDKRYWLLVVGCPLILLAASFKLALSMRYLFGYRYLGYQPGHLIEKYLHNLYEFHKLEEHWKCCGLSGPINYGYITVPSSCCQNSAKTCTPQTANQIGCYYMMVYIAIAGIEAFVLFVLDVLGLIALYFIMRAIKTENEEGDEQD